MARKNSKPADEPAGAPAWVMTFADLMSLLMCFFVLLLSFSELDAAKYKQVAGSMKFAFGVQREVKTLESPKGVSIIAKEFTPGKPQPTLEKVLRQKTTDDNRAYLELMRRGELEKLLNEGVIGGPEKGNSAGKQKDKGKGREGSDSGNDDGSDRNSDPESMSIAESAEETSAGDAADGQRQPGTMTTQQAARIQATMLSIALEEEIDEGLLEVETMDEGVLVRVREQGSFPSGTSDMSGAFLPVLEKIAGALVSGESRLVVSGHTDDRPIATARYPSNWMLSAARATSVVQAFTRQGRIDQERMEVRAHADTVPVAGNDTEVGRARNRRVEIFIGTPPEAPDPAAPTAGTTSSEAAT